MFFDILPILSNQDRELNKKAVLFAQAMHRLEDPMLFGDYGSVLVWWRSEEGGDQNVVVFWEFTVVYSNLPLLLWLTDKLLGPEKLALAHMKLLGNPECHYLIIYWTFLTNSTYKSTKTFNYTNYIIYTFGSYYWFVFLTDADLIHSSIF